MLKKYLNLCFIALFAITMVACGGEIAQPIPELTPDAAANPENSPAPKPEAEPADLKTRLTGTWMGNHEPDGTDLNADGTYRSYMPAGMGGEGSPEEVYQTGTWTVNGEMLVMTASDGTVNESKVNWLDDKTIYLGNIDEEYDETSGSKEEYAMQFGMTKK